CSTSGNYTLAGAYAANLNQFLAGLPENAVSKNGGFFNGTAGDGAATVYGLAMCFADYSRADCGECLVNTGGGLPNRCPGSTIVLAVFDKCLVRYSNTNFLGTAETAYFHIHGLCSSAIFSNAHPRIVADDPPYALMQCTWDLPPEKCKQCLDVLSANASDWFSMTEQGKRKSYSCTVRYSNTSFMVLPFNNGAPSGPLLPPTSSVPASTSRGSYLILTF
ncbi:hypothetical protein BRADI_3g00956v3, partial [Brachypodium distachyon]